MNKVYLIMAHEEYDSYPKIISLDEELINKKYEELKAESFKTSDILIDFEKFRIELKNKLPPPSRGPDEPVLEYLKKYDIYLKQWDQYFMEFFDKRSIKELPNYVSYTKKEMELSWLDFHPIFIMLLIQQLIEYLQRLYDTYYSYYNSHTSLKEYKREQLDTKNNKKII